MGKFDKFINKEKNSKESNIKEANDGLLKEKDRNVVIINEQGVKKQLLREQI